ncbi:hypothetical protein GQ53DRAFT_139313 [Thozetella sp. PMI_491]|nr:hypothetical protein GQ53DRAFT_139313 [Thozetella sp. PMI_491]
MPRSRRDRTRSAKIAIWAVPPLSQECCQNGGTQSPALLVSSTLPAGRPEVAGSGSSHSCHSCTVCTGPFPFLPHAPQHKVNLHRYSTVPR